jgi:Trk-type K+ transport system membrane component
VSLEQRPATARPRRRAWDHPSRLILFGILGLVAAGTALLMLPWSSAGPGGAPLRTALFTAASASCVTGLTVVDTGTYWSGFGQGVIVLLVQLGGLGLMTGAALLGIVVSGRLGLRSRVLAQSENGSLTLGTVQRVVSRTILMAALVEVVVAVVVTARLRLTYDAPLPTAVWQGVFHAVSAYNNAGFALWPDNLISFATDPLLLGALAVAFVVGGLGYPVLWDLVNSRPGEWSLHTRLTLTVTGILAVGGPVVLLLSEWDNPGTLGLLDPVGRVVSGVFSGLSPRTAGFNTFDYAQADPSTLLLTDVLMLVGGGSAGTAGGVKVTTVAILLLAVLAEVRGERDVESFHRRIGSSTVRQALAVSVLAFTVVTTAALVLLEMTDETLDVVLFEVVSATATVGLSADLTPTLPPAAQYVLVALMVFGRVGPVTVATALALRSSRKAYRRPEARPLVG